MKRNPSVIADPNIKSAYRYEGKIKRELSNNSLLL